MGPKDADRMANSVDPDQTAPLIWVYTVCPHPDMSVRKLRIIMVHRDNLFLIGMAMQHHLSKTLTV